MNIEFEYDYLPPFTLHAFSRFFLISWCPRRSPPRKSPTICLSSQPLQATNPPPSPSFCQSHKIVEGGRNYTKILLSSGEEKHVDIYIYILEIGTLSIVSAFWGTSTSSSVFSFGIPALFKWYLLKTFHKQLCCMRAEIGFKVYRCSTQTPPPQKKNTMYSLFICVGIHMSFFIHPSTPHPQFYYLSIQILSNFYPSFLQLPTRFCAVRRKKERKKAYTLHTKTGRLIHNMN